MADRVSKARRLLILGAPAFLCGNGWLSTFGHAQSSATPATIFLSRLARVPDQHVGGEILREIYARLDIKIDFIDVEAKRALALSNAGETDGEIQRIANISKDYPALIQLSPPINYIEPTVFTTTLKFDVQGWESIRDYQVGIVRGVGSSEAGTRGMLHVERATSLSDLIEMLDRDRFDLLVTDLFSGRVEIKKMHLESRIQPILPPLERIYVYHYLHKRHQALVPRVEAVIQKMTESGELEQLRAQLVSEMLQQIG
jgi:polar amino acid transport system substrate-binding protein